MATATLSRRDASAELQRQITFQEKMKERALAKYLAKLAEIDGKIENLETLKQQVDSQTA